MLSRLASKAVNRKPKTVSSIQPCHGLRFTLLRKRLKIIFPRATILKDGFAFMKTKRIKTVGLSLIIALMAAVVLAQTPSDSIPKYVELPNFHQVNQKLYRGAQPKRAGLKRLAQLGVKTILNLRDDDAMAQREGSEARAAGLQYINLPLSRTGRPTDEQVERALAILNSAKNQPVFVHCRLGADRTGTIIAVYRISHDGWTSERAKAEANRYGMHFWETGMKDYIHDYYQRQQTSTKAN